MTSGNIVYCRRSISELRALPLYQNMAFRGDIPQLLRGVDSAYCMAHRRRAFSLARTRKTTAAPSGLRRVLGGISSAHGLGQRAFTDYFRRKPADRFKWRLV